jgi:hypothetical protein
MRQHIVTAGDELLRHLEVQRGPLG